MSTTRLYRALLKAGKEYDLHSWRRANLLHHPSMHAYTAAAASASGGHMLYFLHQPTSTADTKETTTRQIVRTQFRRAAARATNSNAAQSALNHGFEVLRALKSGTEIARPRTPTHANNATQQQMASVSPTHTSASTSCGVRRAGSAAPAARSPTVSFSTSSSFSSSSSSSSGPALRHSPARVDYGSHTSILGRLHEDQMEIQKPKTPTPSAEPTLMETQQHDSNYHSSLLQLSIYADEYLKLVSGGTSVQSVSSTSAQSGVPTSSNIVLEHGNELHLIESSRMRHQHARWMGGMCAGLSRAKQSELESLVQTLGVAVEAKQVDRVKAFQESIANIDPTLVVPLLSNPLVLDAWMEFLYASKEFPTLIRLFKLRLTSGVPVDEYGLSRASMCKVLVACALEGDVASSIMALRESSWAALSRTVAQDPTDETAPQHAVTAPSAVNRLPSWVPMFYLSDDASIMAPVTRSTFEMENVPDSALAAAADGFGLDNHATTAESAATSFYSSSSASSNSHSRLSVNLHARSLTYRPSTTLASFSSLLGSTLLHPPTPTTTTQTSHASMSSLARARKPPPVQVAPIQVAAPPAESAAVASPQAVTPLPLIDLYTELCLDSRLMELCIIAAARSESRTSELARSAHTAAVESRARSHPLSDNPELNLSIHEHAAALEAQASRNFTRRNSQPFEFDEEELEPDSADDEFDFGEEPGTDAFSAGSRGPTSVFDAINNPRGLSPIAYQLWSIMLAQKIPLQHSHTFVELINNLHANVGTMPTKTRMPNILLQTLSSEFEAARGTGSLKNKTMRADLIQFRQRQLALNESLAVGDDAGDSVWEVLSILRQMQSESVKPDLTIVARLYESILFGSEPGVGRSKLLQDLHVVIDDLGMPIQGIIDQATKGEQTAPIRN